MQVIYEGNKWLEPGLSPCTTMFLFRNKTFRYIYVKNHLTSCSLSVRVISNRTCSALRHSCCPFQYYRIITHLRFYSRKKTF